MTLYILRFQGIARLKDRVSDYLHSKIQNLGYQDRITTIKVSVKRKHKAFHVTVLCKLPKNHQVFISEENKNIFTAINRVEKKLKRLITQNMDRLRDVDHESIHDSWAA
ncbi:MAG: HPF/RaiA family ribosome-associated protein [Pseudomonadota bacterium]|nr:HPF/RaiA family ribosome-associated protein [Pseudomonadota bacterium]